MAGLKTIVIFMFAVATQAELCQNCRCHYFLKLLYCNNESLIDVEADLRKLTYFDVLVLENTNDSKALIGLRKYFKTIQERNTKKKEERKTYCTKVSYTMKDCLNNKEPDKQLCNITIA